MVVQKSADGAKLKRELPCPERPLVTIKMLVHIDLDLELGDSVELHTAHDAQTRCDTMLIFPLPFHDRIHRAAHGYETHLLQRCLESHEASGEVIRQNPWIISTVCATLYVYRFSCMLQQAGLSPAKAWLSAFLMMAPHLRDHETFTV